MKMRIAGYLGANMTFFSSLVGWLIWATPCQAQDGDPAQSKFEQGMRFIQEENYPAALEAFQQSYLIYPKHKLLFNIAMCQKALYRYVDAIGTFEKFLREGGQGLDPGLKQDAQNALAEIRGLVGRLKIVGAPAGAEILINGKRAATTPRDEPILLDPGKHAVQVTMQGYEPLHTEIAVASDAEVTVRAVLKAQELPVEEPVIAQQDDAAAAGKLLESTDGRISSDEGQGISFLLLGGIVTGALGLAGVGLGSYFSVEYGQDVDDIKAAADRYNNQGFFQEDRDTYYEIKDDKLPADQAGLIVSFVAAGALIATSVVLFVLYAGETERGAAGYVSPAPHGFSVKF